MCDENNETDSCPCPCRISAGHGLCDTLSGSDREQVFYGFPLCDPGFSAAALCLSLYLPPAQREGPQGRSEIKVCSDY